ncbi:MAG: ABC transporter permease [Lachnospiraceae bacterium]|mgnify:FL=1|nr:ABC transporter permease [Lachnospiraceae bacterium]
MKNSLKQMMRTPVRTILFLTLMVFAAFLMTLGAGIWLKGNRTLEQYEDRFMTIGTVRQIPDSFEQELLWNAETRDYDVKKNAQYSSYFTPEDLLFPGAEYIAGPEQRSLFIAYQPEYTTLYKSMNTEPLSWSALIAEFSPVEDCVPSESVQIRITKVIGGDPRLEGVVDYFCDHRNPTPEMLYKDKTYVAMLGHQGFFIHGKAYEEKMQSKSEVRIGLELIPYSLESELLWPNGSRPEDAFRDGQQIFEVTDGFYETETGRRILNLANSELIWQDCQPVTGTYQTALLMPFYNGQAYICEGRDISEEEYANGGKVCLAPKTFMENNGLSVGDSVKVQLLYTDRKANAGRMFSLGGGIKFYSGQVDAGGNPLEVFETSDYTVVGIYDVTFSGTESIFDPGADELIVPMESIEARHGTNLMSCGPMTDVTSSFRIPNGSIDEFLRGWAQYGTDKLEFTFYDMGYSRLKAGIDNMKAVSLILFASGVILTVLLLFFFSHLYITKQAERTAIERSLGMKPAQCRWSMLSGFAMLTLIGSVLGAAAGFRMSVDISAANAGETYYETAYTAGITGTVNEIPVEEAADSKMPAAYCTLFIVAAGVGIAWAKMNRSLKREPMRLLAERAEE